MIAEMEEAARPAVAAHGGIVLKQEADNLFAYFEAPADARPALTRGPLPVLDRRDPLRARAGGPAAPG